MLVRVELAEHFAATRAPVVGREYDDLGRVLKEWNYYPSSPSLTTGPLVEQEYIYDVLGANDHQQYVQTKYTQRSTNGTNFTNIGETVTYTDKQGRTARIEDTATGGIVKRAEFIYDDASQFIDVDRTTAAGTFFFDSRDRPQRPPLTRAQLYVIYMSLIAPAGVSGVSRLLLHSASRHRQIVSLADFGTLWIDR